MVVKRTIATTRLDETVFTLNAVVFVGVVSLLLFKLPLAILWDVSRPRCKQNKNKTHFDRRKISENLKGKIGNS